MNEHGHVRQSPTTADSEADQGVRHGDAVAGTESTMGSSPLAAVPARPPGALRGLGGMLAADARDSLKSIADRLRPRRSLPAWDAARQRDRIEGLHKGYHVLMRSAVAEPWIDDRTWSDLNMEAVFVDLDRCTSPIGSQYLYHALRSPATADATLRYRDIAANRLADVKRLREPIRAALAPLDTLDAWFLPNLLREDLPSRPRFWFMFPMLALFAIAFAALIVFRPIPALVGLVAVAVINLVIQYRYHSTIAPFVRPLTLLGRFLDSARRIGDLADDEIGDTLRRLHDDVHSVQGLSRAARFMAIERRSDSLVAALYAYINMMLLLDVNVFVFSVQSVVRHRAALQSIYENLGFLDASISIASWRSKSTWCRPTFLQRQRRITFRELVHPLIDDAVANDLASDGKCLLITGSNMAGKTTFIRAVAVNAVLAQTVFTCRGAEFAAPRLLVRSMIGRGDDLLRGQSYFAVELDLALKLVQAAAGDAQHLFVIDEIFRGTNTTERVAAAMAVLRKLAEGDHIVIAATHDLELLPLLDQRWEFHHFRETVEASAMTFDYRIRPGPTSTHNAIRMMEVFGFPADVVADARASASCLDARWEAALSVGRGTGVRPGEKSQGDELSG